MSRRKSPVATPGLPAKLETIGRALLAVPPQARPHIAATVTDQEDGRVRVYSVRLAVGEQTLCKATVRWRRKEEP